MKNKAQTAFLTTLALCVVLLVVIYMYVYQPYTTKTTELEASNATLATRVAELEAFYQMMPTYKAEIEQMQGDIFDKFENFPADTKEEDAIALALRSWDDGVLVLYSGLAVGERETLATILADVVKPAAIEGLEQDIVIKERMTTYTNLTTYQDLKKLLACIEETEEEVAISNIVYSLNKDGVLEGSVDVTFFLVEGMGKEYQKQQFADYQTGVTDLFGAMDAAQTLSQSLSTQQTSQSAEEVAEEAVEETVE